MPLALSTRTFDPGSKVPVRFASRRGHGRGYDVPMDDRGTPTWAARRMLAPELG
jgi:hypothetical protein